MAKVADGLKVLDQFLAKVRPALAQYPVSGLSLTRRVLQGRISLGGENLDVSLAGLLEPDPEWSSPSSAKPKRLCVEFKVGLIQSNLYYPLNEEGVAQFMRFFPELMQGHLKKQQEAMVGTADLTLLSAYLHSTYGVESHKVVVLDNESEKDELTDRLYCSPISSVYLLTEDELLIGWRGSDQTFACKRSSKRPARVARLATLARDIRQLTPNHLHARMQAPLRGELASQTEMTSDLDLV